MQAYLILPITRNEFIIIKHNIFIMLVKYQVDVWTFSYTGKVQEGTLLFNSTKL